MRIGFYAPLKSPNHDVPSGDRAMSRLLIKALKAGGNEVELISELRSWEGKGLLKPQQQIQARAEQEVQRLKKYFFENPPPDLIFSYHIYHKAPDWIGVEMAHSLNIPYVIAEASYAPKQDGGPWHSGHKQTLKCVQAANTIIALNPIDIECIRPLISESQSIKFLNPFLEELPSKFKNLQALKKRLALKYKLDINKIWLITVAMMREGDKATSYKQLADAMLKIADSNWKLLIIGDGQVSETVKVHFHNISEYCLFLGKLDQASIFEWLSISDVFVWPAVNEAYGLALLEAQACGLPAVVKNFGGVSTIVEHNQTGYVTNPNSETEFIKALEQLLSEKDLRIRMSENAQKKFIDKHSFDSAKLQINHIINQIALRR